MSVQEIKVRNMMKHVKAISAFGPRPDGTAADHQAISYIKAELAATGARVNSLPLDVPVLEDEVVRLEIVVPRPNQFLACRCCGPG